LVCPHIRYLAAALLEGGSETQALYFQSLILALVAFPEVQTKAQDEIDRVVGRGRVPALDDLKDLPYVQAIVKEVRSHYRLNFELPLIFLS
jgi:cytochrome P450